MTRRNEQTFRREIRKQQAAHKRTSPPRPACSCSCRQCSFGYHCAACEELKRERGSRWQPQS